MSIRLNKALRNLNISLKTATPQIRNRPHKMTQRSKR